jgi:hypothetical protein
VDSSLLRPGRISTVFEGRGRDEVSGRSFTLDTSLERVFGSGATMLAIEFEGATEVVDPGPSGSSSDSEKEMTFSTPAREEIRKKRVRGNSSFGNLSGISEVKENNELSSEEETSEEAVKKPRLTSEDYGTGSDFDDPELDTRMVTEDDVRGEMGSVVGQPNEVPLSDPGPSHSGEKPPDTGAQ